MLRQSFAQAVNVYLVVRILKNAMDVEGLSEEEEPHPEGRVLGSEREFLDVGHAVALPAFEGACIGDDLSWKGSEALRCVALNTAGSGGCSAEWGRWWGNARTP